MRTESWSLRSLEPVSSPCLPSGATMGLRVCVWLVQTSGRLAERRLAGVWVLPVCWPTARQLRIS